MRYLILTPNSPPFYTKWFDHDNHWTNGMTVIDFSNNTYTTDGATWEEIEIDHL